MVVFKQTSINLHRRKDHEHVSHPDTQRLTQWLCNIFLECRKPLMCSDVGKNGEGILTSSPLFFSETNVATKQHMATKQR